MNGESLYFGIGTVASILIACGGFIFYLTNKFSNVENKFNEEELKVQNNKMRIEALEKDRTEFWRLYNDQSKDIIANEKITNEKFNKVEISQARIESMLVSLSEKVGSVSDDTKDIKKKLNM